MSCAGRRAARSPGIGRRLLREGPAGLVQAEKPRRGTSTRTGPRAALSLAAIQAPISRLSSAEVRISGTVGRCQRCVRPAKRSGMGAQHVDDVDRSGHDDLWDAGLARGLQPAGSGRAEPAGQLVRDLAGRPVHDRLERTLAHEPLHRLTTRAVGVEHDDLAARIREEAAHVVGALGRHAEHRQGHRRALGRLRRRRRPRPCRRSRRPHSRAPAPAGG